MFFLNYSFNTWQTGWDTLHPEFNFNLNIPRHLFGIWQDNQGLGSVGGHSHAADISRILILFISSFVFPANFLRYFYLLITIIAGPLGTYYFLKLLFFNNIKNINHALTYSFIGAVFYLFNIGTVNQYIVQLEMYTSLFGFLPFFFLSSILFFKKVTKQRFLMLVLSCFLVAPSGYAYTVFFSSYFVLIALLLNLLILNYFRTKKLLIKNFIFTNLLIIVLNAYWVLPSFYFAASSNSQFVSESNINTIFSTQIFEHNVKHGNIYDLFTNKGFLSDWRNYDFKNDKYYALFSVWNNYLNTPLIKFLVEPIVVIALTVGAYVSIKRKNDYSKSLLLPFLLSAFMFLTINPPFGFIFVFIRDHISIFKEMYRNPYTKFSVPLILLYSVFFANFIRFIYLILAKKFTTLKIQKKLFNNLTFITLILLSVYCYPVFTGNFISKDIRVNIPNYYFDFFNFMNSEKSDQKAAFLPVFSMWGWEYYKWGYQGAGFMWFGLKQPLLARDFDRWNIKNQNYYSEMFNAIYSKDLNKFNSVLNKYDIGYVIYDTSVFSPDFSENAVFSEQINSLLSNNNQLQFVRQFGTVFIYKNIKANNFVYAPVGDLPLESPFSAINKPIKSGEVNIKKEGNQLTFSKKLTIPEGNYTLSIDNLLVTEKTIPVEIYSKNNGLKTLITLKYILPNISIDTYAVPTKSVSKEFNIDSALNKFYLVLNDSVFVVESGNNLNKLLGTSLLNINSPNNIFLYQSKPSEFEQYTSSSYSYFNNCSVGNDNEIAYFSKGVFMSSYTNNACIASKTITSNSLVEVSLNFTSNTKNFPSLCFKNSSSTCSKDLFISNQSLLPQKGAAKWYALSSEFNSITPNVLLEKTGINSAANLTISAYDYIIYPKISEFSISPQELKNDLFFTAFSLPISLSSDSTINFTYNFNPLIAFDSKGIAQISSTENFLGAESFKKQENNALVYKSGNNEQIFDEYSIGKIPSNSPYFLSIGSDNISGYPLSLVVSEPSSSLYLLNSLNTASNIFALYNSSINSSTSVYTDFSKFSVLSNSISQYPSVNTVKSLQYYPVSLNWLASLTILKPVNTVLTDSTISYSKLGPFIYRVSKNNDSPVVLSQTFDKGWVTYPVTGNHLSYNSWSNVWLNVPSGEFYILFWPALIQLLLYPATFIFLFFVYLGFKTRH